MATLRQTLPPRRAQVQYAPEMELGYDMLGAMTPGRMTPGRSPGMTPSRMSPSSARPRALLRAANGRCTLRPPVCMMYDPHCDVLPCLAAVPDAAFQFQRGGFSMLPCYGCCSSTFFVAAGFVLLL